MAKKKNQGPFLVEGMTVSQILNLGDDVIRHMGTRDLSRAVRTISLAANKRLARLERHAEKTKTGYREKGTKLLGIDFNALQSNQSRFGVKGAKSQGQLMSEFTRVRNFLNAGSSTISGAIQLRKDKEMALFGRTREDIISEKIATGQISNTVGAINREYRRIDRQMKGAYENYNKWKEEFGMKGGYDVDEGREVLARFGRMQQAGIRKDSALKQVREEYKAKIKQEEAQRKAAASGRFKKVLDPDRLKEQWST